MIVREISRKKQRNLPFCKEMSKISLVVKWVSTRRIPPAKTDTHRRLLRFPLALHLCSAAPRQARPHFRLLFFLARKTFSHIPPHIRTYTHADTRYIGTVARFWLDFLLFRCRLAHQTIESCNFPHIHQHTRMNDHTHTQPNTHTYGCIRVPHQVKTEIPGRLMRSFLSFVAVLRHGIFAIRAVRLCTIVRSLQ